MDLASGYWQMILDEMSKEKTAFITHKGLYQFEVIPFGLSNAGAAFQRNMETILADLHNTLVYIDDILVFSETFADHLKHLEELFIRLREANLKLKSKKCSFGVNQVKFLGYVISPDGIKPDEDKIKSVTTQFREIRKKSNVFVGWLHTTESLFQISVRS